MSVVYYERLSTSKCIVKGCPGTSQLFKFPRNRTKYEEWLIRLDEPALEEVTFHEIMKYCRVCADHFEDKCFKDPKEIPRTLRYNAVPTLHMDLCESSSDTEADVVVQNYVDNYRPLILISPRLTAILGKPVKKMPRRNAICILQFDLLPIVSYDNKKTRLAVVFMLRGLFENWKQLYTYAYVDKDIEIDKFALFVMDALFTAFQSGFNVVAFGCKPTSFNIKTMEYISGTKEKNYEYVGLPGKRVLILYDPPNLLIELRNEFSHMDIQYKIDNKTYIASWNDIEITHEDSKEKKCQLLTDEHVYYSKYNKKSVRHAAQVFSEMVGQSLLDYIGKHPESKLLTMEGTGSLLIFFNTLFDSVNGYRYTPPKHKPLYKKVFRNTDHCVTWEKSANVIESMFFIRADGEKIKTNTLKKWRSTIFGIMHLWRMLVNDYGYNEFTPRRLNLDPLDNDITRIRFHHCDTDIACKEKMHKIHPNFEQFSTGFNYVLENGANFLTPLYFTFLYPLYLHRRDLDFEKNPDETKFNCLEDNCSSIATICDFTGFIENKEHQIISVEK